jgi:hypothetical protein
METPSKILNMIRHISVPKNHTFLGIHPILSMYVQSDDVEYITQQLSSQKGILPNILEAVKFCVASSIYPHKDSVWVFNDPKNDILIFEEFIKGQSSDFIDNMKIHSDTYPFLVSEISYTDEPIFRGSSSLENRDYTSTVKARSNPHSKPMNKESSHRNDPSFLVPTLTLGSLYFLSKLASEKG